MTVTPITDNYTRECPFLVADFSLTDKKVAKYLEIIVNVTAIPKVIRVDNGSQFFSKAMDECSSRRNIQLNFIRPGKPIENAFIESFNGKFRDECLNEHIFFSIKDAREKIEQWRFDYNTNRLHNSLNNLSPTDYVKLEKDIEKLKLKLVQ